MNTPSQENISIIEHLLLDSVIQLSVTVFQIYSSIVWGKHGSAVMRRNRDKCTQICNEDKWICEILLNIRNPRTYISLLFTPQKTKCSSVIGNKYFQIISIYTDGHTVIHDSIQTAKNIINDILKDSAFNMFKNDWSLCRQEHQYNKGWKIKAAKNKLGLY